MIETERFPGLRNVYYGWVIVAAVLVIASVLIGVRFSFGVFFKSLEAEFQLNRAATSAIFSSYMITSAVFTIITGWALDRFGPRPVLTLMGLITGAGLFLAGQSKALWLLFLSYGFLGGVGTGGSYIVLMSLVSQWFVRRRGVAMGIAGTGGPIGIMIMAPLATFLIASYGWRTAYMAVGIGGGLIVIAMAQLLSKAPPGADSRPSDDSGPERASAGANAGTDGGPDRGISLKEAFRLRSYWLMLFVWFLYAMSVTLMITHLVPHFTDIGMSAAGAGALIGLVGLFNAVSRLPMGWVSDRFGPAVPSVVCAVIQSLALAGFIFASGMGSIGVCAVLFGFTWGALGILTTVLITDRFGGRNIGTIMGTVDVAFAVGAAMGPALGGFIFDATGGYGGAFAVLSAAMIVVALLITYMGKKGKTL